MSHKVHPKSFRIKGIEDWNVRGFYGKKMPLYLEEDVLIKDLLKKVLIEASVSQIEIEHSANKVNIIIESARPGIIIGRGGQGVETLKKMILTFKSSTNSLINASTSSLVTNEELESAILVKC